MTIADDIPELALSWVEDGRRVAIATVLRTWGSAPRRPGAMLVIDDTTRFEGSVSGGCVEGAVITEALDAMEDGRPRILEFGVADDTAFEAGLACGGEIAVLVEPVGTGDGVPLNHLRALVAARAERRAVLALTDTATWSRRLIWAETADAGQADLFRRDRTVFEDGLFTQVHNPPLRMAVIGAVHIAQPLVVMARLAGYDVALSDPREGFASAARFPGESFLPGWTDEGLRDWGLDARTAVVTLSHDPKIDTPALIEALRSPAFYVGALGSTRTHAKRVAALEAEGLSAAQIARIDAPVGLDIGAVTPAEIAVAIMGAMTEALRRPRGADNR